MKKPVKIGLFLSLITSAFTSLPVYANDNDSTSSNPIIFSPVKVTVVYQECVRQHPEILWLADSNVRKTEEGQATLQGTYSEQLFGQKYVEFDRTIMTIHCLKLILDGSDKAYQTFTASQPKDAKLYS